jgi:hypothetical protein
MRKLDVFVKRPGEKPFHTAISDTLENLQRYVGGYIEVFPVATDFVIICNEEGKINDSKYNCTILGEPLFGDLIFAGVDGEDFADVPIDFKTFKKLFPELWEVK